MKLKRWLLALISAVALVGSTGCCAVAEAVLDSLIDSHDDDDHDTRPAYYGYGGGGHYPVCSPPRHEDAWRAERVSRTSGSNW